MTHKTGSGLEFYDCDQGPILIGKSAGLLRDEVLGKLLHGNILVSMDSVGFSPAEVEAVTREGGGLKVTYSVFLTRDELAALPSIHDELPAPVKKARKKKGKK